MNAVKVERVRYCVYVRDKDEERELGWLVDRWPMEEDYWHGQKFDRTENGNRIALERNTEEFLWKILVAKIYERSYVALNVVKRRTGDRCGRELRGENIGETESATRTREPTNENSS